MENIFFDYKNLKYLGKGAIIGKTVRIRNPEKVSIGDYTIIDDFTYISCDFEIGSYCHIAPNSTISGGNGKVKIGDFVGLGAGTSIHPSSSEFLSVSLEMPSIPKEFQYGGINERIIINNYCQIGAKNTILPGVSLPEGFSSSANSVIRKKKYRKWSLYGGNELKFIYKRNPGQIKEISKKIKQKSDVYKK